MKLSIEFDTDNDAFISGGDNPTDEIAWILSNVLEQLKRGKREALIRDSNGNAVGNWKWE